jgi:hypothetical protein
MKSMIDVAREELRKVNEEAEQLRELAASQAVGLGAAHFAVTSEKLLKVRAKQQGIGRVIEAMLAEMRSAV